MSKPKIFISHSTKQNETEKKDFLFKLYDELVNSGKFEVLLDRKRLEPGDQWHHQLTEWMHECHGAIILLSQKALESDWVKAESTVFAVRDRIEDNFKLIPVLLDDVTPDKIINHHFLGSGSAAHLDAFQLVSDWPNENAVLANIETKLNELTIFDTPFDRVGNVISRILRESDLDSLEEAWNQLGGAHKPTWQQGSGPFADALLRYLFRQEENFMERFTGILNEIHPKLLPYRAEEFFDCIKPLWVNDAAAKCLISTKQHLGKNNKKMASINGKLLTNFTFYRYVEKAWPLDDDCELISILRIDSAEHIQNEMRNHFQDSKIPENQHPPEVCDSIIYQSSLVIVLVPSSQSEGGILDPRIRNELTSWYPDVIFLLWTGESLPNESYDDIVKIEPELNLDIENDHWIKEIVATRFLSRYKG